jgi:hypothetical protein
VKKLIYYKVPTFVGHEKSRYTAVKTVYFGNAPHSPGYISKNIRSIYSVKYICNIPIAMREFVGLWGIWQINGYI